MGSMVDFGLRYRTFISHSRLRDLLECFHSRFLLHHRPITSHSYFRLNRRTPPTNPKFLFSYPPNKALYPHSQQPSSPPSPPTPSTAHQGSPHPSTDTITFAPVVFTAIGSLAGIFRTSATLIMLFGPSYDACCNVLEPIPDKGRGLACATFITCKSEEGILPMATTSMKIGETEPHAFQDRKRGV